MPHSHDFAPPAPVFSSPLRPDPPDSTHTWYLIPGKPGYRKGFVASYPCYTFYKMRPGIKVGFSKSIEITRVIDDAGNIWERYRGVD
jgi:hypothetical protein